MAWKSLVFPGFAARLEGVFTFWKLFIDNVIFGLYVPLSWPPRRCCFPNP